MPDVSLVLALHREGRCLPRTLRSVAEAANYARSVGQTTELVAAIDRPDSATDAALRLIDHDAFESVHILRVDNGSLALTRNDGCNSATGRYIAVIDGADLISFNYLEQMLSQAERLDSTAILIPKFMFEFGEARSVTEFFELDCVTPLALLKDYSFAPAVFFHRSLCGRLIYRGQNVTSGYACSDWQFICDAVAAGCKFYTAHETILFRREPRGRLSDVAHSSLVGRAPLSPLFRPEIYRGICEPWVKQLATGRDTRRSAPGDRKDILQTPVCLEIMLAANAIDPAIEPKRLQASPYFSCRDASLDQGVAYQRLCEIVGDQRFDEVFLLPFLTTGGADRYVLDVMTELSAQNQGLRILALFGEPLEHYDWLERLPLGCVSIDLCTTCPELSDEDRDLLCFTLIQSCADAARLHLRSSLFPQRFFARFAPLLKSHRPVFYRFSDGRNAYGDLALIEPSGFHFVAEHIEILDKVVCDNAGIIAADQRRLCFMPEKWHLLYSAMHMPERLPEASQTAGPSVLWLSRLDREKRPELIFEIARLLAVRMPQVIFDVFGAPTLDEFDVARFFTLANVRYHGSFERLEDIAVADHDCFVYTSRFDGIPRVLLEIIAAGLPIVAPNVGGVGEVIRDRDTGLLVDCTGDDAVDARVYVSAIEALLADARLRERLRRRAWALAVERHAPGRYAERVREIFGSGPAGRAPAR